MFIYHFNRMIRSRILWLIFAIVVGATFLALPSCFTGDPSGREYAGTLGKEKISQGEYTTAAMFASRSLPMEGLSPTATETQIWACIAAIHTAKKMGITASDEELRSIIRSEQAFQTAGQFDESVYRRIIAENFRTTPAGFEQFLAYNVVFGKLMASVVAGNVVSPMVIEDEIAAQNDIISFQYATVSNAFTTEKIDLTDEELRAYYEEHQSEFALADRVGVRFATLQITNFLGAVEVDEADVEDLYDSHPERFSRQGTNGVETIPLEEAHDSIYRELAMKQAAHVAHTNINDFLESLASDSATNFLWRCKARGMKTFETPLFNKNVRSLAGVETDAIQDFRETAHELDSTIEDARYGVAEGRDFIYLICATTNDPAHIQSFEEVKEDIRPDAVAEARQKKFTAFAEEKAAAVKAAMTNNLSFADAAAAQSLGVSTSMTLTAEDRDSTAFDDALVEEVIHLKTGTVSKTIESYNGAFLAYVTERKPGDSAAADPLRESVRMRFSAIAGSNAARDWLIWNLERTGFSSNRMADLALAEERSIDDED